ncbi:non-ribosomal peptide synthetase [Nocardia sp. alder85J]|uniref:non-ribosomal peptide synthetase n=1 Tax=Nocardia sp. alder85J TaxID=2862949 RepID=UPI00225190E4|nr:non-ribosomal peptide synthetase [Nocardia sp. alder85J]MCX4093065.1 amino acid adenylation domain-containing protein [Nocardia sp. alder85J]
MTEPGGRRRARRVAGHRSTGTLLAQLLTAAVESATDAVAIRFEPAGGVRRELTYRELDEASSRLARELIARGAGPGEVVAIGIARSVESVLSVWAVAKTGAAFVPVDPMYPPDRIAYLLTDSGVALGLTLSAHRAALGGPVDWLVLDEPEPAARIAARSSHPVSYADQRRRPAADHLAYVIYTSGSTGLPKGVAVTHRGIAAMATVGRTYGITAASTVLHVSSPSFDFSLMEMLFTFAAGARLVIAPPDVFGGAELAELLVREQVTHLLITPGALESMDPAGFPALRTVVCGGDRVGAELVTRWARDGRTMFNAYGPTEATVMVTTAALRPGQPVTIGARIPGVGALILDSRLRPVPAGVVGELYLSGPGLARGYLGRPGLTADRFVASPFAAADGVPGERLYRTGDLVRTAVAGGPLEYLGRSDFQVKIRGLRIELGEIDNALTAHPEVTFATTIGRRLPSGATALVGYVLPRPGARVEPAALADFLSKSLPDHMIPAAIVVLDELPLTPIGKLDRTRLPEPQFRGREFRAPATAAERMVAEVFAALLTAGAPVGADDEFFELGGDSLLATQAVARIGAARGTRVSVRALFEAPSVAALARWVEREAELAAGRRLRPVPRPDRIPLSFPQQRMWFLNRLDPASAVDNVPLAVRLSGRLDVAALRAAVTDLVTRHEVLRTVYPDHDGIGYQRVLPVSDPRAVPGLPVIETTADEVTALIAAAALEGFDVTVVPPLRLRLLRLPAPDSILPDHVLVCVVNHIAADGFSTGPLTRDLMTAYVARSGGHEPPWAPLVAQYADYALWQRETLGSQDDPESPLAQQIAFWDRELAGLPEQLALPADRPRPAVASHRGATVEFEIGADLHRALARIAQRHTATVFMVVHAALAALLARLSGSADIAIGTPVAGRGDQEIDDLIGMFVNTLVLRTEVRPQRRFTELLTAVRAGDVAAFAHADVPFEQLVERLDPVRSRARHPLFQVMLTFQNLAAEQLDFPGLTVAGVDIAVPLAKFDLHLTLVERHGEDGTPLGLAAAFGYATDLFDERTVIGFADRFHRMLAAVAADADRAIGEVELLAPDERQRVLRHWNDTTHLVPAATLAGLFARQAAATPDAPALVFEAERLSYADFAARVHRTARHLISLGVGPETRVALAMRRSPDLLAGLYAVVAAGAAYVPVDPDHPADRTRDVLDTATPACVLTTARDLAAAPHLAAALAPDIVIRLDRTDLTGYADHPVTDADRLAPLRDSNAAYVIFTSGSTGRPKGVAVTHAAIVNRLLWMQHEYPLTAADVVLQKTPATFDVSVWELFWPLQVGASLVIARPDGHRDPVYLARVIAEYGVTTAHFVPSMLSVFVSALDTAATEVSASGLRQVFASGEALPAPTAQRLRELTGARLHNLYGPTEAAVDVTYHEVAETDAVAVPIGRPVWNTRVYVLDARLHPVAPGVPGELYLAGVQLARGYLGRADLSADRFVADPFSVTGERMYRTGDLVAWTADGELNYLGRTDFQVKLRGLRIELGEIESALLGQPGVAQSVVVVRQDPHAGDQVVGYVVREPDAVIVTDAVKAALSQTLPAYMVPAGIVVLDEFPLNASGKLDRKALPAVEFAARGFRAPSTPIEEIVAGVFADLLGVARVGVDDDFFALGGNSLIATRAVARLSRALLADIPVRTLFEAPTVAALAARAASAEARAAGWRPPVRTRRPDPVPLSPAQQRMWVLNQIDPASTAYNIPLAVRLSGALDVPALRHAITDVLDRHETLRTRYPLHDGTGLPCQVVTSAAEALPEGLPVEQSTAPLGRVRQLMSTGFDVTQQVPVRVLLLETTAARTPEHILVWVVHHIAADGASLAPLARDLMAAYTVRAAGAAPGWGPLELDYADYAIWQREVIGAGDEEDSPAARQLAYWRDRLAGAPAELPLPHDHPRPPVPSMRGASVRRTLPAPVHADLAHLARRHGSTMFMVLHAALAALLAGLTRESDIVIGTPIAGRGERALDELVGMFVNTLALRTTVESGMSFADLVDRARDTDLAAFAHADVPFERVVDEVAPGRASVHNPLLSVMLSVQTTETPVLRLPGLTVEALDIAAVAAKFDLQIAIDPRHTESGDPADMIVEFAYATDLFEATTAVVMAGELERLLIAVAADPEIALDRIAPAGARTTESTSAVADFDVTVSGLQLTALLRTVVDEDPDGPAVVAGDQEMSYRELDAWSSRLARVLIALGCGPGDAVGVLLDRDIEAVVTIWAVLKAGAAVLWLSEPGPVTAVAGDVVPQAGIGVTSGALADRAETMPGIGWLRLDDPMVTAAIEAQSAAPVTYAHRITRLKGVDPALLLDIPVDYDGLAAIADRLRTATKLTYESRTFHLGPARDPAAVVEMVAVGLVGASIVLGRSDIETADDHNALLADEWVTHVFGGTAELAKLDPRTPTDLRAVVFTDGPVPSGAGPWSALPAAVALADLR